MLIRGFGNEEIIVLSDEPDWGCTAYCDDEDCMEWTVFSEGKKGKFDNHFHVNECEMEDLPEGS